MSGKSGPRAHTHNVVNLYYFYIHWMKIKRTPGPLH